MLLREKLRPWKTLKTVMKLIELLQHTIEQHVQIEESQKKIMQLDADLIARLNKEVADLKKDLSLVQMSTESPVNPKVRDILLDPPEPKTWVN
jgi:hypothetical protein